MRGSGPFSQQMFELNQIRNSDQTGLGEKNQMKNMDCEPTCVTRVYKFTKDSKTIRGLNMYMHIS